METEVFGHVKCHWRLEKEAGIVQYEGGNRTVKTPGNLKMLKQGLAIMRAETALKTPGT